MSDNADDNAIYIDDGRKKISYTIDGVLFSATVSIDRLLMPKSNNNKEK